MVWRRKTEITNEEVIKVANELNINELMARILLNRGMDIDNINTIVNEPYNAFIEPSEFTNAEKAAKRIAEYCKNENAIIWIFGDYDVDGFTSVYTMASALSEVAKCEVRYYFPERSEGYGLSLDFCKAFIEEDIDNDNKLVITVDNGISCLKEIEYLQNNGIEVIVTDHHVAKDNVPNCLIVDAHNHNEPETFKHLAGCGVAFKVAQLVQREFNVYNMAKYTFATAIGTIADAVPMSIENIAFIKYGLDIINSDECPKGIKALKRFLGKDVITSSDIAWDIAPRLNACSRMGDVYLGSKVFFTDDVENIDDLVVEIDEINTHRKNATKNIEKYIDKLNVKPTDTVCCVDLTSTDCPEGLVGIAATKITEKFKRQLLCSVRKKINYLALQEA
jgi:single-stranded-DNA-specific exonuclease